MDKAKLITPKKLQGFWELMPKEQMLFSNLLNKIESVFKNNCFLPLDTPVLEYSETLLAKSGGETDKEVYRFSKGSSDMCMRYDLTVPLARFVAMHQNELEFPFKRYQIGKVYRGERPQKGRFREFYQCDADIIGNEDLSLVADAECVTLFEKCYKALDLDITISLSNRKIIAGFIDDINKNDVSTEIMIILDKLNKIPIEEAKAQLLELGISPENSEKIIKLTNTKGSIEEINNQLKDFSSNDLFNQGLEELNEVAKYLNLMQNKSVVYDLSIIRGHNYYTGTVFESFLKGKEELGALGGGGRYENLCSYFTDKKMPGVGMSVGITRLFDILLKEEYFNLNDTNEVECAIIPFDETLENAIEITSILRNKNIKADCLYEKKSFKSKMKEANRRNINYVIIIGENEVKEQKFTLKNMKTAEQETLTIDEIVEKISSNR